jgi:2-polyprenyl-6-methoxyphenol hydroxylase-like FAD-dependent oxidoreductase
MAVRAWRITLQQPKNDIDVFIVGAGPVGLFLANECARRSLRWRIIEQQSGQSQHSKALAIMPRTLEIFDMAGVVAPFLDAANRVTSAAIVANRQRLAHIAFAPANSSYPFVAMVPQNVTETLLVDALRRKGGAVEYETSLESAVQRSDGVDVTVEHHGRRSSVSAAFVVGCDGPHSTVRHLLDLKFEGAEYRATFMLADVETNAALPGDEMQLCTHGDGPLAIFPMSRTHRRVIATIDRREGAAPQLELVRSLLAQRAPEGIEARSLFWSSYFTIHHRQVAQLRVGRIFVAGDAGHIHSPFGAQGMNTGLQDVWNLAWKLDLAAHGRASEELIESYSAERRPVIKHVIEVTDLLTKAMGTPSRFAQSIRDIMIPVVSKLPLFQQGFVQTLSELGIAYHGSPIVLGGGNRYFDESLRGGNGIGSRFLLFVGSDAGSSIAAEAKRLAEDFHDIVELRTRLQHGVALVRPDGYTAYESAIGSTPNSLAAVWEVLGRQIIDSGDGAVESALVTAGAG